MPRTLLDRIGPDTVIGLERAIVRRIAEASMLARPEPLGALYLNGYVIEICLKAAYYRLMGLRPQTSLDEPTSPGQRSPRRTAEDRIRYLTEPPPGAVKRDRPAPGHDLMGWMKLLIDTRDSSHLGSYSDQFQRKLNSHIQDAAKYWRETLRYRGSTPYDWELDRVSSAATWLRTNYRALWS